MLWIFTPMEVLFFSVGMLAMALIWLFKTLSDRYSISWSAFSLSIVGGLGVLFTILWSVSSIVEGETQASAMGLLVIGSPSLILLALARRLVSQNMRSQGEAAS
jgi:hypothetical protein